MRRTVADEAGLSRQVARWTAAILAAVVLAGAAAADEAVSPFPADHRELKHTIGYEAMAAFLAGAGRRDFITVTEEGRTLQGRSLFLVHLRRGTTPRPWRVFLFAQQHGNEVSGKDALLYMIREIVERPERLPEDVDLWIMPQVNPDGAAADQRRNAAGADLNRDHLLLSQPETLALHRVDRRIRPDISVDCHEFTRDSRDYRERGWGEWPEIMMDTANNPLFSKALYDLGLARVEAARYRMHLAGHAYVRYTVGGVPPGDEQRPSTLEADDARNGLAMDGHMAFIVEAGVKRSAPDPEADLGRRVDAYLTLLWPFVTDTSARPAERAAIEAFRERPLPPFIPVNSFWGNAGPRVSSVKVVDLASGRTEEIATANLMHDVVVKRSVATPAAYAILPAAAAAFRTVLDRQGITYDVVEKPRTENAERCTLLRVEEKTDEVYGRYGGRQIVSCANAADVSLGAGTLVVPLDQEARVRAVLLLEPSMLYGLYQYEAFRALVDADGTLPVARIMPVR